MMLRWKVTLMTLSKNLLTVLLLIGHTTYSHFTWTSEEARPAFFMKLKLFQMPSLIHKINRNPQNTPKAVFSGTF